MMMAAADFVMYKWWLLIIIVAAIVFGVKFFKKTPFGEQLFANIGLKAPISRKPECQDSVFKICKNYEYIDGVRYIDDRCC